MPELLEVPEAAREAAFCRFRMLKRHLEEDVPLRVVAAESGIPFRTAQRWVAKYRAFGSAALVRKTRGDLGARRVVSDTIKAAIERLALESHPLPITSVHRQITDYAQAIGENTPSYWTVYDVVRELPQSLRTLAHNGGKRYGRALISSIGGKRLGRTPFGRRTTRIWT